MQSYLKSVPVFFTIFLMIACSPKDNGAQTKLETARQLYTAKEYAQAKAEIDSISTLYPKAFEERKAALALLDSVRKGENLQIVEQCDSLIAANEPVLARMKNLFSFQKDKRYQEEGTYIPKESLSGGMISNTTLRSGVGENGVLYLESVFVGGKQKHNKIKVSAKDGSFVQSLPVTDDGVNYRFSNMGKDYEVIRFTGASENGVAKFIFSNMDKALTVALEGQSKATYPLSQGIKNAVSKSYQLSTMMLQLDSLKTAKDMALHRNYYLDNEKGKKKEEIIE